MVTKVKAIIPEGEAVQLQFELIGNTMLRIKVPLNAPAWFRNWAHEADKDGEYPRYGYIRMAGPQGNHWMTGVTAGCWIIRGNDGKLMGMQPEHFEWFYNRTKEDQQHGHD